MAFGKYAEQMESPSRGVFPLRGNWFCGSGLSRAKLSQRSRDGDQTGLREDLYLPLSYWFYHRQVRLLFGAAASCHR